MPPHPLANFEMQKHCQIEPKLSGVYSINNLPKIKDGPYVINLHEFKSIGTHWIALYVNAENETYFRSFGVKYIPKKIRKFIGNKNLKTNLYRIKMYDSIVCRYFCIRFISFMVKGKNLLVYRNLISLKDYDKNDKIMSRHFQ